MKTNRFHIVFEKLDESDGLAVDELSGAPEISPKELDDISELRRLSMEFAEQEYIYNTST